MWVTHDPKAYKTNRIQIEKTPLKYCNHRKRRMNNKEEKMTGTNMLFTDDFSYSDNSQHYRGIYSDVHMAICSNLEQVLSKRQMSDKSHCFTLADFGTADGSLILPLFDDVIKIIRQYMGTEQDIQIIFEDQRDNDFNELFKKTHEWNEVSSGNVYILASGTSMYRQCLPCNSLDFAFSFTAMHWLSKRATIIRNGISQFDASEEEIHLLKEQSQADYLAFLISRAKELKSGGAMFISCPAWVASESGNQMDKLPGKVLRTLLLKDIITQEEYLKTSFQLYCRTKEDFLKPFKNGAVSHLGIQLEEFKIKVRQLIPALHHDEASDLTRRAEHAQLISNALKAFLHHGVRSGLNNERRDKDKKQICDVYFREVQNILMEREFQAHLRIVSAEFFLKKT